MRYSGAVYKVAGFLVEHFSQTATVNGLLRIRFKVLPFQDTLRFCIAGSCGITSFPTWLNAILGVVNVGDNWTVGSKVFQNRFSRFEEVEDMANLKEYDTGFFFFLWK